MSKVPPWYKRTPVDWRTGTRSCGMSMELRGFYSECLDAMWELQGQLPKDVKILSIMLGTNARLVRALLPKLIALGKLIETEKGYYNPRMMADILGLESIAPCGQFAPVSTSIGGLVEVESSATGARVEVESRSKIQKNPDFSTRDLDEDEEIDKDTPLSPPSGGAPTDFKNFSRRRRRVTVDDVLRARGDLQ